jgi:integral membrane sensor domain MASE1
MTGAWAPIQLKRAAVATALVAGYAASVLFSFLMSRIGGQTASIWTANGFLAGSFLLRGGRGRAGAVSMSLLFQVIASLAVGDGPARAVLHTLVNLAEASLAAWLAVRYCGVETRRLSLRKLALLILASVIPAAILGGVMGASVSFVLRGTNFIDGWLNWAVPGGLGMAIVLPALLLVAREGQYKDFRRSAVETGGLIGGVCGLAMAIYFQQELPLQFAIVPALTLVAFRLGPPGAAISGFLVAMICLTLVMLGHGPTMLATTLDHLGRVRLTEVMVTTAFFTTLATASAVAEQVRLRRLLLERDRAARGARERARDAERMVDEAMQRQRGEPVRAGPHFV